jgi:hypothetical protein
VLRVWRCGGEGDERGEREREREREREKERARKGSINDCGCVVVVVVVVMGGLSRAARVIQVPGFRRARSIDDKEVQGWEQWWWWWYSAATYVREPSLGTAAVV